MADGDRLVLGLAVGIVLLACLGYAETKCSAIMPSDVVLCDLKGVLAGRRAERESG